MKSLIIACALVVGVTALSIQASNEKPIHQGILDQYKPEQVSDHVWVIHGPRGYPNVKNQGFMNNPSFIIGDGSVAIVDPGSSVQIGRAILQHLRKLTDKPITHVFTTHVHGDHWLANQAIKEDSPKAQFYAHPSMITEAEAGVAQQWVKNMDTLTEGATKGTEALIPTEVLEQGQEVDLGGLTLKAHIREGKVHTDTDVMYELLEDKVLYTGDNFNNFRIVRMEDGSFAGSISAADYALALDVDTVVPGHGPTSDKRILKSYQQYLSTVYESVRELREDKEAYEMKPEIRAKLDDFEEWQGLDDELGKHISLSVTELEIEDF